MQKAPLIKRLSFPLLISLLSIALSTPTMAGYTRFTPATLTVDFPCMEVIQSDPDVPSVYYQLSMLFDGAMFNVVNLLELDEVGECFAVYNQDTGILTDQLWHKDKVFDVTLTSDDGFSYALDSLAFRERSRTSLWKVSNGNTELFIGGTIHILHADDFPLPESFTDAFFAADILVTEISQDDLEGEDNDASDDLLINPEGLLSEILLPDTLEVIDDFLDRFGVTLDPVDNLKPVWAALAFLQLRQAALGYGPGVDYFFQSLADLADVPNLGLETSVSQVNVINTTSESRTADEIILSAIEAALSTEYFDSLDFAIQAWREGNIEYFEYLNDLDKAANEEEYNLVLRDRNLAWVPQIEDMLETDEVEIILVGVGHLAGDDNVLELLAELGYTIERY